MWTVQFGWSAIPWGTAIFCMVEAGLMPHSGSSHWKGVRGTWMRHIPCLTTQVKGTKWGWACSLARLSRAYLQFHSIQLGRLREWIFWVTCSLATFPVISSTPFKACWEWLWAFWEQGGVCGRQEEKRSFTESNAGVWRSHCMFPLTTLDRAILLLESNDKRRLFLICRNNKVSS